jgi:hypothetical protein
MKQHQRFLRPPISDKRNSKIYLIEKIEFLDNRTFVSLWWDYGFFFGGKVTRGTQDAKS